MRLAAVSRALVALALLSGASAHGQTWICTPDHTLGFSFDPQQGWQPTEFAITTQYEVKPISVGNDHYGVTLPGERRPRYLCGKILAKGSIRCADVLKKRQFLVNIHAKRYLHSNTAGYYDVIPGTNADQASETPFMEMGRCWKVGEEPLSPR